MTRGVRGAGVRAGGGLRNRLRAVRSLFERQRVASGTVGTLDVIAVAVEGTDANAQVFQVRDGVLADRQSFYLENRAGRNEAEVAEEFAIQYYATSLVDPAADRRAARRSREADVAAQALEERRGGPVELRHAQRGDKRRLYELAERNARLALEQDKLRTERRRQQRVDALNDLREALGMDALPVRIECFDISNLGPTHTVASMVVFEGGAPKKSDYRRFKIRELRPPGRLRGDAGGAVAAGWRSTSEQRERSPHDPTHDASFAALPALIVIDGGKGQLSSGVQRAGASSATQGVAVISLAKRLEEIYVPGRAEPIVLPRDSRGAAAAAAHPRRGAPVRDRAPPRPPRPSMTRSVLDELPGIGPARKRALLRHFGSPERFLARPARSWRRCPAYRERSPARSTSS